HGFEQFIGAPVAQARTRPQGLYLRNPNRTPGERELARDRVRREWNLPADARLVLCAGYADQRKGLDLFVETCRKVAQDDPRVVAMWVGHAEQALFSEVQDTIRDAGMDGRFVFTGRVDNPQDYFSAADVYALTSREDPFPSVVME